MSNKNRVPPPTCRGGYQPTASLSPTASPPPPTTGSNAVKPKTDSVVNTDFLFTALQQQVENNTKLVQIVVDLTHRLEQSAVIIDGLNHTIISLAKGETTT